ncbi:hypothetical protein pipiens_013205 [Culex pipiens pipiens]|uniref:Uncharacterized protein n=1 Tax=Culex pipiens pipiens TaxID=38569 RepID=A0ABD1CZF3_CULPP
MAEKKHRREAADAGAAAGDRRGSWQGLAEEENPNRLRSDNAHTHIIVGTVEGPEQGPFLCVLEPPRNFEAGISSSAYGLREQQDGGQNAGENRTRQPGLQRGRDQGKRPGQLSWAAAAGRSVMAEKKHRREAADAGAAAGDRRGSWQGLAEEEK